MSDTGNSSLDHLSPSVAETRSLSVELLDRRHADELME